ncbi:MAG: DUF3313 domain-containing protein [Planctomycetota bacterium]|jgi:hypothetical protein
MEILKKVGVLSIVAIIAALLGGCAGTKQARSVEPKSSFIDYSMLEKGKDDEALLHYQNPSANLNRYSKVMLDPVLIYKPQNASQKEMADLQKLATNFYVYLGRELRKDYKIVDAPEPGTISVQAAITGAEGSRPVSDLMSSVVPIGAGVSVAKDFATGKPMGVGEMSMEMKVTDAMTGELLAAAADRRAGGKNPKGILDTWNDANLAMDYWAKRLRYFLCLGHVGIQCTKP